MVKILEIASPTTVQFFSDFNRIWDDVDGVFFQQIDSFKKITPEKLSHFNLFFLSTDSCENLFDFFSSLQGTQRVVILVNVNNDRNLDESIFNNKKVIAVLDVNWPIQFCYPFSRSIVDLMFSSQTSAKVTQIGQKMNNILSNYQEDLGRIKKLHQRMVKVRSEDFNGLKILSKYLVGEAPGGEFFDIINFSTGIYIFISNANSYLASTMGLSLFEKIRLEKRSEFSFITGQLFNLSEQIKSLGQDITFEVFLAKIEFRTLIVEGYNFGRSRLISSSGNIVSENTYPVNPHFMEKAKFKLKLERNENIAIFSPGVKNNIKSDLINNKDLLTFAKEELNNGGLEFLNELYFHLKKGKDTDFLEYDASTIVLEVSPNAILKV